LTADMKLPGAPLPHVLLVEDDRDTREMYSEYLSYSGMKVTQAATGRRGLEHAQEHTPDVVVTDIAMPEMDGLEMSRRLRSMAPTRDVPIIAVSGQASERAREAGADVVLDKPCEPDRLLHAIEDMLKAR
jgi:two-component system, cell cycle response regulator DivK